MNFHRRFVRLVLSFITIFSHVSLIRFANKKKYFKNYTKFNSKSLRFNLSRIGCVILIGSLLVTSTPAAVPIAVNGTSELKQEVVFWAYQGNWLERLYSYFFTPVAEPESNQNAPINRIEIYPGGALSIGAGSKTAFAAIAYDSNNNPIPGVRFHWQMRDIGRGRNPRSLQAGLFEAELPGTFKITVQARGRQAESVVVVTGTPQGALDEQLANAPRRAISSRQRENPNGLQSPDANVKKEISKETGTSKAEDTAAGQIDNSSAVEVTSANMLPDGGWNDGNWQTADDPGNTIGDPPGKPLDGGAGNGNFQLSAPVLSLSGRNTDLALNLNYNSRLWNKSGTELTYDIDRGFPAPGWSLGFGKVAFMGAQGGCMLVDADGTRHSYTGQISSTTNSASFNGYTTDGSFIDYGCNVYYGQSSNAWAKLPNGTIINYSQQGAANDHIFPTSLTDAQGNYITITYRNGQGPSIETITDTLGRIVQFQYDALGRLISVSAPKPGSGTRTLVKLHYRQLTLNYSFTGVTPVVRNNTPYVIDAIYYPATGIGYWFGDADSYSSYGMIAKVVEQRGMSWSAGAEEQGTVSPGAMTKQSVYSYPLNPAGGLNDAPTYGQMTETWDGMDDTAAVTTYEVSNSTSPRTVTVTQPDGTKSKQYSYNASGLWNDGLVYQDETYDANNNLLSRTTATWSQGEYNSPRAARTDTRDERGQTTYKEFDYTGGRFNQVTRTCDYGYDGSQLRCTNTEYENSVNYVGQVTGGYYSGRHIFNLVKATEVRAPDNTRVSRTVYEYDNASLTAVPAAVVQHKDEYDPYTTTTRWVRGACLQTGFQAQSSESKLNSDDNQALMSDPCIEWEYYEVNAFDSTTNYRGNVTKVTSYSEAQGLTGAVEEMRRHDITGNMVSTSSTPGEETSFVFDDPNTIEIDTQYAYQILQTRGSADPNSAHRITTRAAYDFNTGLETSSTDANGRASTIQYNAETLRPTISYSPTGAYTSYVYDDAGMTATEERHEAAGGLAEKSIKYLNGIGKVKREESLASNNTWDVVETKYDKLGREWKQASPYRAGVDTPQWTETIYDALGRITKVIEPDGSQSQAFYNETNRPDFASTLAGQTVRSVDAWGREQWVRKDEQGRLVEVVEPNPNGSGSVLTAGSLATKYKYDALGRLIETEQGDQRRYFAYDSLGRLTRQKLAEQTATLNNHGVYVGAGGVGAQWSEAFWYGSRSNLIQRTDARGVKTLYSYQIGGADDPLNRLQSVAYDLSGPRDPNLTIYGASNVTYQYETTGDKTRLKKVTASGVSTEDYVYDAEGRMSDYTLTLTSRSGSPLTTSYAYDTLDRVTDVLYPAQYGIGGSPRKIVHHDYDTTNRLSVLKYDGQTQASEFVYNASEQATSLKIGTSANQLTEEYNFDQQTGLLTNQKVKRANGERLLDLSYEYRRKSNGNYVAGRTGHLTEIINNLDRNKDRNFEYDALGRLVKATGGINQTWTQRYVYDRYGNRTGVIATGMQALRAGEAFAGTSVAPINGGNKLNSGERNEQNSAVPKSHGLSAIPPSAEQLVQNINNFVKVGGRGAKGASSDSPNSGNETSEEVVTKPENNNVDGNQVGDEKTVNQEEAQQLKAEDNSSRDETPARKAKPSNSAQQQTSIQKQSPKPSSVNSTLLNAVTRTAFDFDGDGRADLSTWGRTNGNWTINRSGSGQTTTTQLGASGNQIAPGDYDGDGKTDEAVWNPSNGVWTIKRSSSGVVYTQQWGVNGDAVVPADYDGDGKTDIAVWRPSTGYWYVLRSSDGSYYGLQWGGQQFGDIPAVGDYDGDNRADSVVWRPSNGNWYIYILQSSSGQYIQAQWGQVGDVPVPMDYDGDRKTDLAVWRPSNGYWYVSQSSNNQFVYAPLGSESTRDVLAPADYDGDGRADMAVWTPSTGTWTIRQSMTGTNVSQQLGASSQLAVPSAYIRRSSAPKNQNAEIQTDGLANLSYDPATNRITTANANGQFEYDAAGNQIRALAQDGQTWLRYEYDAANRLVYVKNDAGTTILQSFSYGATNLRLTTRNGAAGDITYYAWAGGTVLAEYTEYASQPNNLFWTKSYVFLGSRLLSTFTSNGQEYHHPDRLGTTLISNPITGNYYEQATLPFGTALASESTGATNRRFTSYDRSNITGLDYAVNRTYDSQQGRFTQVDPIGFKASTLEAPQTLNLYSYCGNDPINHSDPDGLFWGAIGRFFKAVGKILSAVGQAISKILNNRWVQIGVFIASFFFPIVGVISSLASEISSQLELFGLLLQGKFKQLGIAVAIGIAGSYLGVLEDAIQERVLAATKSGGSIFKVLKNAVNGAVQGFREGVELIRTSFGRPFLQALIPIYGLFGGPGYLPDDELEGALQKGLTIRPGRDAIDNKFKTHDIVNAMKRMARKAGQITSRAALRIGRNSDWALVKGLLRSVPKTRLIDLALGGRFTSGSVYKFMALNAFTGSTVVKSGMLAVR